MLYCRDGEPFQRRVPIFRPSEFTNYLACQTKNKEYWAIMIAYNITFYLLFTISHVGQQSKVPTRVGSRRQRCNAICNNGSRGLSSLSRVWTEPQSQTVFGKYLIEWSSFSSTFYHFRKRRKILTRFKVDDVVIQF